MPLVYHHHMNSTGEPPEAIEAILAGHLGAVSVGLLFDIAHYQQGGGDPVAFIRQYGKAIKVVHLKDVRPIDAAPGYQWVELGRGRVDVKGCVAALRTSASTAGRSSSSIASSIPAARRRRAPRPTATTWSSSSVCR